MKVVSLPSLSPPVWLLPWVVSFSVMTLVSQVINGRSFNHLLIIFVVVTKIIDELYLKALMSG